MFFGENELNIELIGVFKIKRENFNHKSFDNREYDSLSIRTNGTAKFITDKKTVSIKKGELLYIPKKADYKQTSQNETVVAIHFINYSNINSLELEKFSLEDINYTEEIFTEMYNIWKEKKQGYKYLCLSLFYNLLYTVNCSSNEKRLNSISQETQINKAIDYIHRNYRNSTIEISYLASMCAISETYFRRIFKKIYGVSPQQYILNLKLEFAYHLLGSNLYTVSEVSQKSGFLDPKYFSRIFKAHYNCTPKHLQLNGLPIKNKE